MWIEAKTQAINRGYRGLRLTGNTAFLKGGDDWNAFMQYENAVREAFRDQQLLALCSYECDQCDADAVLDVVQAHDFALARRRGTWEVVESASVKTTKEALVALNAELEWRIELRTRELSGALAHQQMLTAELSHRVKNTIASMLSIVDQTLRGQRSTEEARRAVRGRLSALAAVHDTLAAVDWRGVGLKEILLVVVSPFRNKMHLDVTEQTLAPRAALSFALIFHELATNAAKYGALGTESGQVAVQAATSDSGFTLGVTWLKTCCYTHAGEH